MPSKSIIEVLIERDRMPQKEAENLVKEAREDLFQRLEEGEDGYDICEEWFGLEPDYLMELM